MAEEKKVFVTKEMLVGEVISRYPDAAFALMQCGMGCVSCPASQAESLAEASMVHGMNVDEVVDYVNEYLAFQAEGGEEAKA
ncbi:disulfide oxidoreductase [Lachnospiraceae bacterium]|nr:disulfide oxidoreductase [Lachnospiraceae bacterium]